MNARRNYDSMNRQSSENGGNLHEWKERVMRQDTKPEEGHKGHERWEEAKGPRERN